MPLALVGGPAIFFAHVLKTRRTAAEDYLLAAVDLAGLLPPLDYSLTMMRTLVTCLQSKYRYQAGVSRTTWLSFLTWLRLMLACFDRELCIRENHIQPQSDLVPDGAKIFHRERDGMRIWSPVSTQRRGKTPRTSRSRRFNRSTPRAFMPLHRQEVEAIKRIFAVDYGRFGFDRRARFCHRRLQAALVGGMMPCC